ncbi:MAG: hypothetical protein EYC68_19240 [Chloroflexota bacterium]|nr:MAG: hypothetical protein EYC68_19240 [Chloroflexota bacterium]
MQVSNKRPVWRVWLESPRVWLILVLLLAWGFRLYHLGSMSIWWDESLSWDRATSDIPAILANTITIQTIVTRDLHPPLYFLFLHFAVLAAGATEFALRFLSLCANVLTLAALYPLACLLFGKRGRATGLLAVLFAAISPLYVWYAQEARPYALVLLWSVLALYALLRWLKTNPSSWRDLFTRWAIGFGVMLAASLATLYLSFVLLPFFALTLWLFNQRAASWRARLKTLPTFIALLLLGAFAAILFLLPRGDALASWDQVGPRFVPLWIMLRDVWNSFVVGVTMNLDQAAWLDLFLLALWLVGIFSTIRAKPRDARLAIFLLAYILIPALAMQLGSYLRPLYLNSRHLITTSPAFYFGIALGVDALARRLANALRQRTNANKKFVLRPAPLVYLLSALLIALPFLYAALTSLNNLYFDAAFAKDNHKAWSQFLRERLRADDYLLLVAPQAEKIVEYYAPEGLQWESLPHLGRTLDWQEFLDRESVLNAYRNHRRVWFLEIHQPVGDPKRAINHVLYNYGKPTDIYYFSAIASRIILQSFVYRGVEQKPDVKIANPTQIVFDDNLHLLGYDAPQQLDAGARDAVKLYWRLDDKTPHDISASLRVVDAQGNVWGQWDAPPVGNLFPLSKWETDKIYLDIHDFVVDAGAPPGDYFLELNLYRAAGHEPLAAKLADGTETNESVRLAQIQVTRPNPPRDPQTLIVDAHTDLPFGNTLRFVGYDIGEQHTNPGSAIPLTLYFQVMQPGASQINGQVELAAPWWQFWNRTRAATPFALDLSNRQAGEIVQARVNARVPGDANAGTYDLQLARDDSSANTMTFANVIVEAIARSTDLPTIENPLNARLGDSVEFLGYDIASAPTLKPNDSVKLRLYWRALKPMDTSYKVFAHLLGSDNQVRGQQDNFPLDGARPTTSWAAGEIFTDTYEFNVAPDAPSGTYQIEIGMYNPDDSTRLSVLDANGNPIGDRILFGELRVQ